MSKSEESKKQEEYLQSSNQSRKSDLRDSSLSLLTNPIKTKGEWDNLSQFDDTKRTEPDESVIEPNSPLSSGQEKYGLTEDTVIVRDKSMTINSEDLRFEDSTRETIPEEVVTNLRELLFKSPEVRTLRDESVTLREERDIRRLHERAISTEVTPEPSLSSKDTELNSPSYNQYKSNIKNSSDNLSVNQTDIVNYYKIHENHTAKLYASNTANVDLHSEYLAKELLTHQLDKDISSDIGRAIGKAIIENRDKDVTKLEFLRECDELLSIYYKKPDPDLDSDDAFILKLREIKISYMDIDDFDIGLTDNQKNAFKDTYQNIIDNYYKEDSDFTVTEGDRNKMLRTLFGKNFAVKNEINLREAYALSLSHPDRKKDMSISLGVFGEILDSVT